MAPYQLRVEVQFTNPEAVVALAEIREYVEDNPWCGLAEAVGVLADVQCVRQDESE